MSPLCMRLVLRFQAQKQVVFDIAVNKEEVL